MTVLLRVVRGTVATAFMSAGLALSAGAQGIPMVTSAKAAANKAAAASNAQTAAMQNTSAASPANTAKPSTASANPSSTTTTSVTSVRTTTVAGFSSSAPQASQQHQQAKTVASQAPASPMKPVVSVGSAPAHATVSATATAVPAKSMAKAMPASAMPAATAGKAAVATTGPLSDSAGKSISVTQRGTRGEVSLNREVYSYDAGARRDPFVSLMRSGELRPMLSDLRLVTVLYDPTGRNSIAVMHDLSTKDQYRVRVGQTLGRMRVAQIQPKQVVFTVEEVGFSRQEALALGDTNKARMQ
jgi:hypothetical protein